MPMTLKRLKVLNEHADRVMKLKRAVEDGIYFDCLLTPETRAQIDDLVKRDLEAQLAEAQRQFEAA